MIVGVVRCECILFSAHSLKEKRSVVQSILRKAVHGHNLSASEVAYQDSWQHTELAFACVGSARSAVEHELSRALSLIDFRTEIERVHTIYEWF
ncbi:DUF503 domain-containing protein [Sporolactobacillus inulinus]|jgi:uncharacterized protein YlxP (DUF503 family)|uniref:YlxP-like protein n=2 Tax=Sporolactobacillus inulinus TaxID=2078 RepID=A0A4Y3T279_9BACL|nr:DUF503 family protein [Sporolactobacillus inulinus]KLI03116.1 hypothetical protein SINU_04340 [Sporolactobacillus inulinus CASD]GAY74602.1 YlxP-like protein [Sporolactobacillus inulinus]GEB75939.1 hypothetical protein SIN01_02840 [Sporolactobacillus inulinus]